jgi:two-component system, NarL family, sensor histidine kinase EvgS
VLTSRQQYSVWSLDQLGGRRLAMLKGFFGESYIRAAYPTITLVLCDTVNNCLDQVEGDSADAFLYGLQGLYERLQSRQSRKLQITGTVGGLFDEHNLGLSLARGALATRLRDGLASVVEQELPRIERDWALREAAPKLDWQRARQAGALLLALLVAALVAWWAHSRRLKREFERTLLAQTQAEQSRAASEEYLAFMAHEVRNSLQSVSGAVALIHQPGSAAQQPMLLDALARSSQSTLSLLNGLLDRHRLQEGRLSLVLRPEHLSSVLQDVIEQTRPAALAKGLVLRLTHSGSDEAVQTDALRVQQIVRNLLVNAVKFSSQGQVTVHLSQLPSPGASAKRLVSISVQDEGPGLDAAAQLLIFERHYSQGGDRPGSGLGLSLSRDLAHNLGGSLTVRSALAEGATFTLNYEADVALAPSATQRPALTRLLVLEDSPVYMILLEQALQNQGLITVGADTLGQARKLLSEAPAGYFDLVLCDTHLPDGHIAGLLDWAERQRAAGQALPPFLCMSAEFIADEANALRRLGALDALTKDGDVAAFVRAVLAAAAQPLDAGTALPV